MSITSLSFTFVNTYASQAAKPAASAERQAPVQTEAKHCDEHRPATRQNRLVEAMMSALRELGFGSPAAAAPAAAPAATDAPAASTGAQAAPAEAVTTTDQATATAAVVDATESAGAAVSTTEATQSTTAEPVVSVESAVHQFAHELFRALRAVGRGESSEQGGNRIEGDGGRRHHHGHHGWRREGYGDMAQRLDALSQTFAAPAAVAAASDAQPDALVSTSISITLTVQDGQADAPVEASSAATPAASTAAAGAEGTEVAAATAAPEPAKNPLLEAFSKLFDALKPESAGAPQVDMADKLHVFLQTLAQAMRPESMSSIQTPQVGGLVNVTA